MAKLLQYAGATIKVVGDCHLGRKFMNGVPFHRRGDREAMMWAQFYSEMSPDTHADVGMIVQVGDIFDKAVVPYDVVMQAAKIIKMKAAAYPNVKFVVIAGNHDLSKDVEKVSAFQLLAMICQDVENIHILTEPALITVKGEKFAFFPYSVDKSASDVVLDFIQDIDDIDNVAAAFGHWDTTNYGGDNTMPHSELARLTEEAYTGHIHLPGVIIASESYRAEKIGSMQPMAHGEEVNEDLYVTRTLDQLAGEDFTYKCLRVLLKPGEEAPSVECLQLTVKRVDEVGEVIEDDIDVNFDAFNMDALFSASMTEAGVSGKVSEMIKGKLIEMRGAE